MKAAFLFAPLDVRVEEVPLPKPARGEILVKMRACGVCGTDVEKFMGHSITTRILGHEVSGEIAALGEDVEEFRIGERVFIHHHVPCYTCHYCRHGDYTLCESFIQTNIEPCGFAEYFKVPEVNVRRGAVMKIPESLSFEEATLIEPMACCLRALRKIPLQPGDDVAVLGAGPTGLIHVALLKAHAAGKILVSDVSDFRLEAALSVGANAAVNTSRQDVVRAFKEACEGRGPDVVIVSTGSVSAVKQALDMVRRGGTVLLFGSPAPDDALTYELSRIFIRETKIISSYSTTEIETHMALRLMQSGRLRLNGLITHRFTLKDVSEALRTAADASESLKVIVSP